MDDFRSSLSAFTLQTHGQLQRVVTKCSEHVHASITDGSPLTGAPGQPVDTGYLKASWTRTASSPVEWHISTNVAYAPVIEHNDRAFYNDAGDTRPSGTGPGGKHIKSTVGGNHSVELTRAAWPQIVAFAVEEVNSG